MNMVVARRIPDEKALPHEPGEFKIVHNEAGAACRLVFACPCGCGDIGGITLKPAMSEGWEWDGNEDKPTCSPSIRFVSGCQWHGYLKSGMFESC
jgi:hypothetical protein